LRPLIFWSLKTGDFIFTKSPKHHSLSLDSKLGENPPNLLGKCFQIDSRLDRYCNLWIARSITRSLAHVVEFIGRLLSADEIKDKIRNWQTVFLDLCHGSTACQFLILSLISSAERSRPMNSTTWAKLLVIDRAIHRLQYLSSLESIWKHFPSRFGGFSPSFESKLRLWCFGLLVKIKSPVLSDQKISGLKT
jgi:hypothetical protein